MGWVDSHCHLQLDDRPPGDLLDRAVEVDWVVVPGIDLASSVAALELASRFPDRVLATVGLHPHDSRHWQKERDGLLDLMPSAAAVGETGLDFYRNHSPRRLQLEAFGDQASLAVELGKPLVVHCRDAFAEVYNVLESTGAGRLAILHCWTGGPRWTRRFLDLEVTYSFAGPVAFANGETVRLAAAAVPPERVMVETDTPYLAPPPHRDEPNEPAWVSFVGGALADVWGLPIDQVAATTSARAAAVFGR